jgi:2-keto-4-pentenoate hydratase/2-oxohepta-3-ene-1,7-dioic acid hydratase in catechol pathway
VPRPVAQSKSSERLPAVRHPAWVAQLRFSIADLISYLSRHAILRPGDLIATGTSTRLTGPMGPERHLQAGDVVTVWVEQIGELTSTIG